MPHSTGDVGLISKDLEEAKLDDQFKGKDWGCALGSFRDDALAVAVLMLRVSAWKHVTGAMNNVRWHLSIDGAHGRKGRENLECIPFRATQRLAMTNHHDLL